MINLFKRLFLKYKTDESVSLNEDQKKKLDELLYKEEVAGENRVNRLSLFFIVICSFVELLNWLLMPELNLNAVSDFVGFFFIGIYQVIMFFVLKKKIYHRVFKYITAVIIVNCVTVIILGYSIQSGWIHTLRTSTVIIYCVAIIFMGFYQSPKMPIFAGALASIEYLIMFFYALATKKIDLAGMETFLKPVYSPCILLVYITVFILCGLSVSIIANRLRIVLRRALYSETEAYKKEIERQVIENASRQKIDFFINLAHEMKTPLTLISNYFGKYVGLKGKNKESDLIENNFNKMKNDMINFLDLEKLERGQIFYRHDTVVDFSKFLREKCELFRYLAEKKGIELISRIKTGLCIKIDAQAVDRLVNNLIDNSVKYTNCGGRVMIELTADADTVELIVGDNGLGISAEEQEHIFESYYQVSHEKRNSQGMGLGLSIVKKIIEEVDGSIRLESEPGRGTTFTVGLKRYTLCEETELPEEIPCSIPMDNSVDVKLKEEIFDESKPVVLIVEDNLRLLVCIQENLLEKYNVYYAINGMDALNKLEYIPYPSIIICDIMMEVMDGYEFFDQLTSQSKYKPIPFIFLTAKSELHEKIKGLSTGAIDYMAKPFSMEELKVRIATVLKNIVDQTEWQIDELKKNILDVVSNTGKNGAIEDNGLFSRCAKYGFSKRETAVAVLLCSGMPYKDIASKLYVSDKTVSTHVQRIYQKTGSKNKMDFLKAMDKLDY
jgi:signal transduction histidine kinase/DNA-binding NarL/FixJ family response regulator